MKITNNAGKELTIEEAISNKLYPDTYSYDGSLEKLNKKIELQSELISRLVACLYGEKAHRLSKSQQMEYLLGYGYEVNS